MTAEELDALINALAHDAGLLQDGAARCEHRRTSLDRHPEPTTIFSTADLNTEVVVPIAPPARLRARILAAARADRTGSGRSPLEPSGWRAGHARRAAPPTAPTTQCRSRRSSLTLPAPAPGHSRTKDQQRRPTA